MSAKYTPAPWKAGSKSVSAPETDDRLGLDVRIYGGNRQDNAANARLIAAAPELLEACKLWIKYDLADENAFQLLMMNYANALNSTKAAINKAEGAPS